MKFSVLLPTRNRLELLRYAVETVRRQSYSNWEIIISDNCSDEDVASYTASLGDPRIQTHRTERFLPVTENWNRALHFATGDYVIMLGDDDGLMPGYFDTLARLAQDYGRPDLIYTDAQLFGYPGVLPHYPTGYLRPGYNTFFPSREPHLLAPATAADIVRQALAFRMVVQYNMQLSLIRREFIHTLAAAGPFFQSPFPDYYATVASFLNSRRTLIFQQPVVTIGISPKSYGYYYFNQRQSEGAAFLNNLPPEAIPDELRPVLLPGGFELTCWLIAMHVLSARYRADLETLGLRVDYARYRRMQASLCYSLHYLHGQLPAAELAALEARLSPAERWRFAALLRLAYRGAGWLRRLWPDGFTLLRTRRRGRSLFEGDEWRTTEYQTLLDVFERPPARRPELH